MKSNSPIRSLELALGLPIQAYGLLLILGVLTWAGVVHSGHVTFDTEWLWRENTILSSGELRWLGTIWSDFSPDVRQMLGAEYLPVRDTNTLIDFKLFGDNWTLHHGANLFWYLAACTLFLSICRHLLGAGLPAWLAATWFALHPVHTENVAWLASRKDLLGLTLALAAWRAWLHKSQDNKLSWLSILLFILAVWSKNTYIVLPAVMMLGDWLVLQKRPWQHKTQWLLWAVVTAPLILLSVQLGKIMRLFGVPKHTGVVDGLVMQAQLWSRDLRHLGWPAELAMVYPVPSDALGLPLFLSVAAVCGLVLVAWWVRRKSPVLSLGICIFFLASLPTTVFMSLQNLSADRYLLLPSAGVALALGAALQLVWTEKAKPWLVGFSLGGLATLSVLSTQQASHWRSDLALWSASAQNQPSVLRNVIQHAHALGSAGQPQAALEVLEVAESQFSRDPQFFQGRATVHFKAGDEQSAERDYRHALSLDPDLRISGNDLAIILSRTGRLDEAILVAERMTSVHTRYAKGFNTLGALLLNARLLERAETALLQAELLSYQSASAACNLGGVYWLQMQIDPSLRPTAVKWWTICKARKPGVVTPPGLVLPD